jgi:hypothetical protein
MRDLFFLAVLPFMLYAMAKRPFIAVGMWIWTAMFFPNAWLYGMASGFRYNLLFTGIAILGYLMLKDKPKVSFGAIGAMVFLFFLWTTVSTVMTEGLPEIAWEIWIRFFKVILLFVFVILVLDKKLHFDFFLWCVVVSIGFYGGLEALKYVASGGGHKIEGFHGHVLGDRNELALAFVMTLPVCAYLIGEYGKTSLLVRVGLIGLMGLLVTAIVGTQSRGGFVALLGLAGYFFLKSDRKIVLALLAVVLVAGATGRRAGRRAVQFRVGRVDQPHGHHRRSRLGRLVHGSRGGMETEFYPGDEQSVLRRRLQDARVLSDVAGAIARFLCLPVLLHGRRVARHGSGPCGAQRLLPGAGRTRICRAGGVPDDAADLVPCRVPGRGPGQTACRNGVDRLAGHHAATVDLLLCAGRRRTQLCVFRTTVCNVRHCAGAAVARAAGRIGRDRTHGGAAVGGHTAPGRPGPGTGKKAASVRARLAATQSAPVASAARRRHGLPCSM